MGPRRNIRWDEMEKGDFTLDRLIAHFSIHNRSEGKSPSTVEWYDEVLGQFLRWLTDQGHPTNLGAIDLMRVKEFVLYLQGRPGRKGPLSSHTVNNRVRALRSFFNWLQREGYTEDHLLQRMRPPKLAQLLTEPLSDEEVARVFATFNTATVMGARNAAIFALLLDTGLRRAEWAGLAPGSCTGASP